MARKRDKAANGDVTWAARAQSLVIVAMLRLPRVLPYNARLASVAWIMGYVFAPLAGYPKRIRANLSYVCPELPETEIRRLCRAVPANVGRTLVEITSPEEFKARLSNTEPIGLGVPELERARATGRPIIAVTGHFGNFDAPRAVLTRLGYNIGALYRPINDPYLDKAFYDALTGIASPIFPRGRKGLAKMVRFLRQGNMLALVMDQYVHGGTKLTFFGKTAPSSLSAAELALRYDALLVTAYGRRKDDGFDVIIEGPIAHSDPATMMQEVNDRLEAQVRGHLDQWLWIHRRWKKG